MPQTFATTRYNPTLCPVGSSLTLCLCISDIWMAAFSFLHSKPNEAWFGFLQTFLCFRFLVCFLPPSGETRDNNSKTSGGLVTK